jgi:hypothetical protein
LIDSQNGFAKAKPLIMHNKWLTQGSVEGVSFSMVLQPAARLSWK